MRAARAMPAQMAGSNGGAVPSADPVLLPACAPLKLSSFRQHLIRQEETIIFAFIERAQFPRNPQVYKPSDSVLTMGGQSLMDYMLRELEICHAKVRRYTSPDEQAFFAEAVSVQPVLPLLDYPATIRPNAINRNDDIKRLYLEKVLPEITSQGDDNLTMGSCAVADITCLQALSKRIHYGKFIAEAKFQANPEAYTTLINAGDSAGLMRLLTDLPQEERVLDRVQKKASTYGQDPDSGENPEYKVDPKVIRSVYQDIVMPLTKEVQVEYLLQRLSSGQAAVAGKESEAPYMAATRWLGGLDSSNFQANLSPEAVFSKVLSNASAFGVVVLESGRHGAERQVKQLLVRSNLKIVGQEIVDLDDDQVRCIVIAKHDSGSSKRRNRSCVAFGTSHHSGALRRALSAFHDEGVNLSSIESLPRADSEGTFSCGFFVELEGALDEPSVQKALQALEKEATFIRHLGSYNCTEVYRPAKKQRCNAPTPDP